MSRFSTLLVPLTALLAACSPVSALTTSTAHAGGSCGFIQNTDLRNYCSTNTLLICFKLQLERL